MKPMLSNDHLITVKKVFSQLAHSIFERPLALVEFVARQKIYSVHRVQKDKKFCLHIFYILYCLHCSFSIKCQRKNLKFAINLTGIRIDFQALEKQNGLCKGSITFFSKASSNKMLLLFCRRSPKMKMK